MCLVMNLFPSFSDLYRQMADVDAEYSRQCIDHYRAFLRGPPNRPTRDRHGFLSTVITFLEQARARPLRAPASLPPVPSLPRLARAWPAAETVAPVAMPSSLVSTTRPFSCSNAVAFPALPQRARATAARRHHT